MTTTPDLDTLLELIAVFEQGAPDNFLERALPALVVRVPGAKAARVYRLESGHGRLQAATDSITVQALDLNTSPAHQAAVYKSVPVYSNGLWAVPLKKQNEVFGLLEIIVEPQRPEPAQRDWLALAAYHLAGPLANRNALEDAQVVRAIANNLVLASRMITTARSYEDMTQAVVHTAANRLTAVALVLFDRTTHGDYAVSDARLLTAVGTPSGSLNISPGQQLGLSFSTKQLDSLRRGSPVIVNEISSVFSTLTAETQQQLHDLNIHWSASFGLRAGDQILGTLDALHVEPAQFTPDELDAFTTLADQIGVALENRALLEETRVLYEVNRSILEAQDTLDVLRALRQHLVPDAMVINHMTMRYDKHNAFQDAMIDYLSLPGGEQVVEIPFSQLVGSDKIGAIGDYWNQSGDISVSLIEDMSRAADNPLLEFSRGSDVRSYISFLVRERGVLQEAVNISFNYPQVFNTARRRLYEALSDQIGIVLQSHRLLREAQVSAAQLSEQVRVLETLNHLGTVISATQDEQVLLDRTAHALATATGADHCGIVVFNPNMTIGRVASESPLSGLAGTQIDLKDNVPFNYIREKGEPFSVNEAQTDPRLDAATRELFVRFGIHAVVFIPVFVNNELFGALSLDMYTPGRHITPQMIDAAQTIIAQMALRLQNVRLLADAQRRAEQLGRITDFSQAVQATLDMGTIFNIALTESAQMLLQDHMRIAIYDPVNGQLKVTAKLLEGETTIDSTGSEMLPIAGHVASVWENWELLYVPDWPMNPDGSDMEGIRSLMIAPIVSRGRALGLVTIGCYRAHAYTDADIALFQQMVNQLGVAIENADAFNQSQKLAKNEALVNEISGQLQRQMNIQNMLTITVSELGRALGARRARIHLGTQTPYDSNGKE
jgi:GAF domain-containing protein